MKTSITPPSDRPLLYIGIMSGTSADGIDLALVDFSDGTPKLKASFYQAYDQATNLDITRLYSPDSNEIDSAFSLDIHLAKLFAAAVNTFLVEQQLTANDITAIGNHGQTIRHRPELSPANNECFTVQIGCSQTLAVLTKIRVIGQFRQKDIALGGQGAPLVPAFHQVIFTAEQQDVFVLNVGGVANISYLPMQSLKTPNKPISGFDTGPGNALLDSWYQENHISTVNLGEPEQPRFDNQGQWAKSGTAHQKLLTLLLADDYFSLPAPKSTGREYFNIGWLSKKIALLPNSIKAEDIQATLSLLTARTIADAIIHMSSAATIYVCGGGLQNTFLLDQLQQLLTDFNVVASDTINIDSDSLEAMAFAWLAYAFDHNINSNMPEVTGASRYTVLGVEYSY